MTLPRYIIEKTLDTYSIWDTQTHEYVAEFKTKLEAIEKLKELESYENN